MVFARIFRLQGGVDDHAFVMKKTLNGGWVLMDSALPDPLFSNPLKYDQAYLNQKDFFKLVDEIWVYKFGEVEMKNHGKWYPYWLRIIREEDSDYSYLTET